DREVCAAKVGARVPSQRLRRVTRRGVAGNPARTTSGSSVLHAVPVLGWNGLRGALAVEARVRSITRVVDYAGETARALAPLLERLLPSDRGSIGSEALLDATDRRLARFGFDLHDGPLQALSLLAVDLATFDRQLPMVVSEQAPRRIAEGRVAALMALAAEAARA